MDVHKLNKQTDYYNDTFRRLRAVVDFAKDAVGRAERHVDALPIVLRKRKGAKTWPREDFLDQIAKLMFETVFHASAVREPVETCWEIQHNTVWSDFFHLGRESRIGKAVLFKLSRLLFDEIRELETLPHYKSARILGLCLNVMGLKIGNRKGYGSEEFALRKAVLNWTKKNYLKLVEAQPEVAAACLAGRVTLDAKNKRLIKTYFKGLQLKEPEEYLDLEMPSRAAFRDSGHGVAPGS